MAYSLGELSGFSLTVFLSRGTTENKWKVKKTSRPSKKHKELLNSDVLRSFSHFFWPVKVFLLFKLINKSVNLRIRRGILGNACHDSCMVFYGSLFSYGKV